MTMSENKRQVSKVLFHIIVALITDIILIGLGAIVLFPTGILSLNGISIFVLLIFFISLMHAIVLGYVSRWSDQIETLRYIGWRPGIYTGLFAGYFLGDSVAGVFGGIVGAILFYFIGRWIGPQISTQVGSYLESFIQLEPLQTKTFAAKPKIRMVAIALIMSLPVGLIAVAYLMMYFGINIPVEPKVLLYLRPVLVVYSLILIGLPWIFKERYLLRFQSKEQIKNPDFPVYIVGLTFSISPSIFGLILFLMAGSILELWMFCIVAILATIVWTILRFPREEAS